MAPSASAAARSSEPAAKIGLVDLYGEVWRTGGTKTQTGDQMDDYLEARAAKVETGGGGDSTTIGWSCLKADFDDVFKIVLDLLHNPEFRADKLELAQSQFEESIARRNDDPRSIAARESIKLAYGADNPYARQPEYATILAVKRDDLLNWHKQYVHPNNMIVGISGDFDSAAMEAKLKAAFASWPKGPAAPKTKHRNPSRQARLLPGQQRRREPDRTCAWSRSAPTARQSRLLRDRSLQRSHSAAASRRASSKTFAPSRARLLRGRRHRHQLSIIPASRAS